MIKLSTHTMNANYKQITYPIPAIVVVLNSKKYEIRGPDQINKFQPH